jgi:hypothetical protein
MCRFNTFTIFKRHVEQDSTWEAEISLISGMTPDQVKKFVEHPIKALTFLQPRSVKIIRYREQVVEIN